MNAREPVRAKRRHDMPFGAEFRREATRFRLWAPGARTIDLALDRGAGEELVPMQRDAGGWYEIVRSDVAAGARYRYRVDGELYVPDPVSRYNPEDVSGPSEVIDPEAYDWTDAAWHGRPWEEAVVYELHVGAFTPRGDYAGLRDKLDYLAELGVSAIELMPLADFSGRRGWGYDGVLPYAPDSSYGRPEELKRLVDAAHGRNLMVLLDVVYNHFGPEGNHLRRYAPQFCTERHRTPWGAAIDFDGPDSRTVRDYFIHNALYWLEEFHFDGLRFDAVHAICDDSSPDIVEEIAELVRAGPGRSREVHLVLENDRNTARYLKRDASGRPLLHTAQWNDDAHHCFHVLLTGETDGYYADYAERPAQRLGRCLAEGFAYQGEPSPFRDGEPRGGPSADLPPTAFVSFLQNHDQIGNRAFGERLARLASPRALAAAAAILLLAPSPPLVFMGEEFAAATPFLFFCDFGGDLARAVREGRRNEFARFARFRDPAAAAQIPDPGDPGTFERSKLDWASLAAAPHSEALALHQELLALRAREIVPLIAGMRGRSGSFREIGERALEVRWRAAGSAELVLLANLGDAPARLPEPAPGKLLHSSDDAFRVSRGLLPAWSAVWLLHT
jgi:malto-oligosyltrehalose trehalohydrolase